MCELYTITGEGQVNIEAGELFNLPEIYIEFNNL